LIPQAVASEVHHVADQIDVTLALLFRGALVIVRFDGGSSYSVGYNSILECTP
jgi:hypothetical protein